VPAGAAAATRADVYVTQLRAPSDQGWLTRIDLIAGGAQQLVPLGPSPSQNLAYDAIRDRLYVTGRFAVFDFTPLRWLELALEPLPRADAAALPVPRVQNFAGVVRGADIGAIALSRDGARAYAAMRLFDRDLAASLGGRTSDVGGALAVIDLVEQPTGGPFARIVRLVPVGVSPGDVEILPRVSGPDVVAVTSVGEGTVSIYDDAVGAVVAVLGDDRGTDPVTGRALPRTFGEEPFALASLPAGGTAHRLFVASFDRGFVQPVLVDTAAPSSARVLAEEKFGREAP
jgi:hypothetical protein